MDLATPVLPCVLVTGATRGLGWAIAHELASTHHVVVGGRDAQRVDAVVASLPSAAPFVADLADEAATASAAKLLSAVDVLVHCAGMLPPVGAQARASWRAVLELNAVAVVHLTELLLPRLRESRGLVVFVNSGSGLQAMGDTTGYSASKFALTSYADGLRAAERGHVRVSSLHPGRIDTQMQRDLQARSGRAYVAEEHMPADAVAAVVRAIVDAPPSCVLESVSVRPSGMVAD